MILNSLVLMAKYDCIPSQSFVEFIIIGFSCLRFDFNYQLLKTMSEISWQQSSFRGVAFHTWFGNTVAYYKERIFFTQGMT